MVVHGLEGLLETAAADMFPVLERNFGAEPNHWSRIGARSRIGPPRGRVFCFSKIVITFLRSLEALYYTKFEQ